MTEQGVTTSRYNLRIEIAVLISLVLHATTFGLYQARHVLSTMPFVQQLVRALTTPGPRASPPPPVIPQITFVDAATVQPAAPPPPSPTPREPNVFMETDEDQTAAAPPANTEFYGTRNTVAANPENPTGQEGDTPYLTGDDDRLLATKTVLLPRPASPPPPPASPPPGGAAADVPPPEKPAPVPAEGLTQAEPPPPEPRKLAMLGGPADSGLLPPAPPAQPAVTLPGRAGGDLPRGKSRLVATGVARTGVAAFNVAESPFGAYDRELIRAVQSRWLALIDRYGIYEQAGTVTLYFELYDDGSVRNLSRKTNTGGEMAALWCEKAVTEAAPFMALPENLRLLLGGQPRDVTFTFYY